MTLLGTEQVLLQNAATANGNGTIAETDGFLRAQLVEVVESGGGTATITFQGSFDGTNWYGSGYQQIDATATPARSVTGASVTANSKHVYQLLDYYPAVRAVVSAIASATVTAKLYAA